MKLDVAAVGEIYIDHIFTGFADWPQPGEETFTRAYHREVGGGAANISGALSTRAAGALAGLPTRKELRDIYDETYA